MFHFSTRVFKNCDHPANIPSILSNFSILSQEEARGDSLSNTETEQGLNYPRGGKLESISRRFSQLAISLFYKEKERERLSESGCLARGIQLQLGTRDPIAISTRKAEDRDIPDAIVPDATQWPPTRTSFALRYLASRRGNPPSRLSPPLRRRFHPFVGTDNVHYFQLPNVRCVVSPRCLSESDNDGSRFLHPRS